MGNFLCLKIVTKEKITKPAVSHNPRLTVLPSTTTLALKLSNTVGT